MAEPQNVEQCVLMDVEPGSGGSVRPRRLVEKRFRPYDQKQPMLLALDGRRVRAEGELAAEVQALCHKVRKLRNSGFHWVPTVALS